MASRYSAARPKRAGEAFARAHHGEDRDDEGPASSKKVKFDVRNPSALAPSAQDEDDENDDVLAADVIGTSGRATKRGAVNIDGYDSDSENENFNARAEARVKKGKEAEDVDFADAMDNYGSKPTVDGVGGDDEEVDMFGDSDAEKSKPAGSGKTGKKHKEVRFLAKDDIEGEESTSKSGGRVRLDDKNESDDDDDDDDDDDEAAIAAAIAEEAVDEEVGAGGLKKHAPKIDAFNMRQEQEEGAFDEAGNYIRKAVDADAVHDRWLEGVSKKEMKKAAAAHERRDAEQRRRQRESDSILTADLLKSLILRLELGETALDALARLRRGQTKPKKVPKWKQKRTKTGDGGGDAMDVDTKKEPEDPKQVKIKEAIDAIADAADKLMQRDYANIYDTERERLIREYRNETGEDWVEPPEPDEDEAGGGEAEAKMWEFRWIDGRDDGQTQGPFDGATMKAWQDAGYFGEGVEFRPAGDEAGWTRIAGFV
ncbi:GYF domain-containing protein [Madurella fahalii]|uniref:GYF domain-containing protein n=1 Tax=Madurella fahalii TaxID=1157608 RepID=A0ABQ0G5N7_9PEZI